jgi:hypothetical protein
MEARRLVLEEFKQVAAHVATIVAAFYLKHGGKSFKCKTSIFVDVVASRALATGQVSCTASA